MNNSSEILESIPQIKLFQENQSDIQATKSTIEFVQNETPLIYKLKNLSGEKTNKKGY